MTDPTPAGPGLAERATQRVGLFVDTQNLYYAARDGHGAAVDYARLMEFAARGRQLRHATAYVVEREGERTAYGFVTKLSALGYRVRRRLLRVHRADDDGRLVLDGDFVPMLRLAQERGVRVEVLAFRATTSQELIDLVDRFDDLAEVEGAFVGG